MCIEVFMYVYAHVHLYVLTREAKQGSAPYAALCLMAAAQCQRALEAPLKAAHHSAEAAQLLLSEVCTTIFKRGRKRGREGGRVKGRHREGDRDREKERVGGVQIDACRGMLQALRSTVWRFGVYN